MVNALSDRRLKFVTLTSAADVVQADIAFTAWVIPLTLLKKGGVFGGGLSHLVQSAPEWNGLP